jgi:rhodanese-related sulfurtransferase
MRDLTPEQAHEFLSSTPQALLVDVRSFAEFWFVGHPVGAVNVSWSDERWSINEQFVDEVQEFAKFDQPLVLICRSGKRSRDAMRVLADAGYSDLAQVLYGFEGDLGAGNHRSSVNGWRFEGLPWEQG